MLSIFTDEVWTLDLLIRTNSSFSLFSPYQFILIFVFIVLVDFKSNTNTKATPFNSHFFTTDSLLNYTKTNRRTSSPVNRCQKPIKQDNQQNHDDDDDENNEVVEDEEEEEENDIIETDENVNDLDEDSCNR